MDDDELASLTEEEKKQYAEDLGIPLDSLDLKPKAKDLNPMALDDRKNTNPKILIDACDSRVTLGQTSNRRSEVNHMLDNFLSTECNKDQFQDTTMAPRR